MASKYRLQWKHYYSSDSLAGIEWENNSKDFDSLQEAKEYAETLESKNMQKDWPCRDFALIKFKEIPLTDA